MKKKSLFLSYTELSKPRILFLVLITTTIGYYLGTGGDLSSSLYLNLLAGVALTCAGSSALNHYLEREYDSKMLRTQNRPLPSGTILPSHALTFGILLVLFGIVILYVGINILASFLALLASFLYILVYTPMKRVSWLNTTCGAVPGAIPPLIGWAAGTGTLNFQAGMLFLILFIWQHPHFYAIGWMFKDDYQRAGFKMLPCLETDGKKTLLHIQWTASALIIASIIPSFIGMSGRLYLIGALFSGILLLLVANGFIHSKSLEDARKLLKATVVYIPVLLLLIVLDANLKAR